MHAAILIANGSEELETITTANVLVRAGIQVTLVSCEQELTLRGSRNLALVADCTLQTLPAQQWDMVIVPGGMPGAAVIGANPDAIKLLQKQKELGWCAAICAAPAVVLAANKLLGAAKATGYPAFASHFPAEQYCNEAVVIDVPERLITSQGPATALAFGLAIVEVLCGKELAQKIAAEMLYQA